MKNNKDQFWAIPKWILEIDGISLEQAVLYGVLFTRANGENISWPGQKNLANTLRCSEKTIRRHLQVLKEKGLITVKRMGLRRTNRYILDRTFCPIKNGHSCVPSRTDIAVSHPSVKEQLEKNSSNIDQSLLDKFNQLIQIPDNDHKTLLLEEKEKFIDYWTEGYPKRELWQIKRVFDVKRRWGRWLRNVEARMKPKEIKKDIQVRVSSGAQKLSELIKIKS